MKDRIPTHPGRVKLVPVSGSANTYDLERADSPTQAGTPLNKASLLTDATAAAIGLTGSDPTVNDALGFLAANYNRTYYGTAAPTLQTPGKRGDIYIQDAAGSKRRFVYICDAVGEKPVDIDIAWERGSMVASSITNDDVTHRVRSDAVLVPKGTKFSISSGFKYGLRFMNADHTYNSYVAVSSDDYTLTQDKLMRILIIRATENTSENANVTTFSSALSLTANGYHWMPVGSVREVEKEVVFTSSGVFIVPADLRGNVTIRAFGGGAGGSTTAKGYGGGGGHMAVYTGPLTAKRYNVTIGKGGAPGSNGGASSFGSLVTANGGSGASGGTGGGGGYATGSYPAGTNSAGNGTYGGGGGGGAITAGGNGGTYGGGGGGGGHVASGTYYQNKGGSGKNGAYSAKNPTSGSGCGTGGAGYSAAGGAASSSHGSSGGAGENTNGYSLPFEGNGTAGTYGTRGGGGGGGFGGKGGTGNAGGGGGGGYGADGGNGSTRGGGGGGGFGGNGGNGSDAGGGGGGGYGLSGNGGDAGKPGGTAAGGGCGAAGGSGVVIITYTGVEAI